jgi:hypothetical protein
VTETTPDAVIQVASGFLAAKHLFVASEVGLFERLAEGPATLDEMARRTQLPRRTLRIIADAMVTLGLVERLGDQYRNSHAAATFLTGGTPADLRPFLRLWNRLSYPRWTQLEQAVRTDRVTFAEFSPEEQQLYSEGVEAITAGTAQALATAYDFSRHRRVLDLGGGTGSFLMAVLGRYRSVESTLYDLPAVGPGTRRRLSSSPLADRIRIVEGDFFKDAIPDGHDAVIVANVMHCFPPEPILDLLRRTRARVASGARLLLVDFWTDRCHTAPPFAALMAGEFLLTPGGGDVYSVDEAREWLQETGWRTLEHRPLTGPASVIVAEASAS